MHLERISLPSSSVPKGYSNNDFSKGIGGLSLVRSFCVFGSCGAIQGANTHRTIMDRSKIKQILIIKSELTIDL